MKAKNTRKQLVLSILAMLLCVSMLVGATFAWFTDEVKSGMNTIAAGNLDIELYAGDVKVESDTKLFDDVELWEPGVVVYENLEIKNVGSLALKYQLTLNFGNENDLNGHKLSEVLKVAIIDEIAEGASRADVLAAAKAADACELSNLYWTGALEAGDTSGVKTFVIFWEPDSDEIDNLYNANNGQKTSDGEPLHIEFGVTLLATQKMSESDSFGNNYDEFASILPKAKVVETGAKEVNAYINGWNGEPEAFSLDTSFQFQPNESAEEAESSAYKYWHADYVVVADKDVKAGSLALAGYYQAFADSLGNDSWVALTADEDIAAGTEIRLVELLGATVNYSEICQYGNDGTGFLCGVSALDNSVAGTTITVELRLYETTVDPANPSGNKNKETGKYEVIGTYTHTFPAAKAGSADELNAALAEYGTVELSNDLSFNATGSNGYGVAGVHIAGSTLDGNGNSLGISNWGTWDSAINITSGTVKNLTVNSGMRGIFVSHNGAAGKVYLENVIIDGTIYTLSCDQGTNSGLEAKDCTFNGWTSYAATLGDVLFTDCSFGEGQGYAFCRPYAPTTFVGCDFEAGYEIDARAAVVFENCTINGVALTADNLGTLVIGGTDNVTVK